MNLNINITQLREKMSWRNFSKSFSNFFLKEARILVILIVVAMFAFCVYLWYGTVYHAEWSEAQKQEYIKSKGSETVFNKNGFQSAVDLFQARQNEYQKKSDNLPDIFNLRQ